MKVWIYVEGQADQSALGTLWAGWKSKLSQSGWGIQILPLSDKSRFFRNIGPHAAEKLANNGNDLVVGLPDLYPNATYSSTEYRHTNLPELKNTQSKLVRGSLVSAFGLSDASADDAMIRFYPSALKHDLEMLLLAAVVHLRSVLDTSDTLGNWRHPVEEQNQNRPPKRIVEELFYAKRKIQYRDTVHASGVLRKVTDIKELLYSGSRQLECPAFKEAMDWIASKTGVAGY
jgi:hypothetical protein